MMLISYYPKKFFFSLLWTLIHDSLLNILKLKETDKILEETALLIKSTKCFGTQENNQTVTLFEKIL